MRNAKTREKCQKRKLSKCKDICKTYNIIQFAYAEKLESNGEVKEYICNYPLLDFSIEGSYTTDFYCIKTDGSLMIRECVFKKHLTKPLTIRLLDASRNYWLKRGVDDWGIVVKDENYEEFVYLDLEFDWWYQRIYFRNCEMINQSDFVIFYVNQAKNSGAYKICSMQPKRKNNIKV